MGDPFFHSHLQLLHDNLTLLVVQAKVPVHNSFLRVLQAQDFSVGHYFVNFIHVQVASGAIVVPQQRKNSLVPPAQHTFLAGVFGVKANA